ncbi:MAG: alpha/beta hydrolase [Deltaproteobacteria bacterium]|nr:alpha/beta hydrolase [Deltaproteobacteria bacterium]
MNFLEGKGARVRWQLWGDELSDESPCFALINGYTRSSQDFRRMATAFVREGFRVLSLDNRGCGETWTEKEFSLKDMAEDWLRLWDHLGIQWVHLAGISMGGLIARVLLSQAPEKIRTLTLISTVPEPSFLEGSGQEGWPEDPAAVMDRLRHYVAAEFYRSNKVLIQAMAQNMVRDMREHQFGERAAMQRRAILAFDVRNFPLPDVLPAVQVIQGKEDQIVSPEAFHELIRIFQAEGLMLEGAGHLLLAEKSTLLQQALLTFCRRG